MSNSFGDRVRVTVFGQSHGEAIGVVVDGLPVGFEPDWDRVSAFMARRAPGRGPLATPRAEADEPRVLSGFVRGRTCGAPVCAVIENRDPRSRDYQEGLRVPRPSHADFPAYVRYGEHFDARGGGQFSGRLTAPLCFAGALCLQLLERRAVYIGAQILQIGEARDLPPDSLKLSPGDLRELSLKDLPVFEDARAEAMREEILSARASGDSVGGTVRLYVLGLPAGLGEPMFDGLENRLAAALFAIPGARGLAFGAGFEAAGMRGSQHNDAFAVVDGRVRTLTNRHGGVLGGMSTGMPLLADVAFKPTPSIALPQQSVDLKTMTETELRVRGRHDPCIVPRALPSVEALAAITLLDFMLKGDAEPWN